GSCAARRVVCFRVGSFLSAAPGAGCAAPHADPFGLG
ncbi:hypothetical protein A2U01_0075322, partial [Trifolium medium]|nr:hypothetical protein [Trifolium medium]